MGGNGFVGSAFFRQTNARGYSVTIISRQNYTDFVGRSCDIFINAAGNSKKYVSDKDPKTDFDASVRTVCDSLHDFRYDSYVLCSSCDVYEDVSDQKKNREDSAIDQTKISRYGFHKLIAEQLVRYEVGHHLILRLGGFVGPGLKKNPIYDILTRRPLWLHPDSRLQYISTDVAASIALELLNMQVFGQTFNICGDSLVRLSDVIRMVNGNTSFNPGCPKVTYEICIERIKQYFPIPDSMATIREFLRNVQFGPEETS